MDRRNALVDDVTLAQKCVVALLFVYASEMLGFCHLKYLLAACQNGRLYSAIFSVIVTHLARTAISPFSLKSFSWQCASIFFVGSQGRMCQFDCLT